MRRYKQQLPSREVELILEKSTNGILSIIDPEGYPYGVPLSFVYDGDGNIYFHCATSGRKIECIRHNPKCCFTVVDQDEIHPAEFTTYFRSVIAEGKISIIEDIDQKQFVLQMLSSKYSPGIDCVQEISKGIDRVLILKMKIEIVTGKEAIELTRIRESRLS